MLTAPHSDAINHLCLCCLWCSSVFFLLEVRSSPFNPKQNEKLKESTRLIVFFFLCNQMKYISKNKQHVKSGKNEGEKKQINGYQLLIYRIIFNVCPFKEKT